MLTSLEKAREMVLVSVHALEVESVPVSRAAGRHLARDVPADRDLPPADRSAMDGFAVRAVDIAGAPVELEVCGQVAAGSSETPPIRPGTCVKIFTGANVPPDADTVVIVETTRETADGRVLIEAPTAPGENIRRKGEAARKGDVVLEAGTLLGVSQIATCAAVGVDPVPVHRRPTVAVLCTGAELRAPSDGVRSHEERNANGPALLAALDWFGLPEVLDLGTVEDRRAEIASRLARGLETSDIVVVTGGVSRGDYDLVPDAIRDVGAVVRLHGVRVKPGKPFLFATMESGRLVFGLPGNPLSVLVSFWEYVVPSIAALSGDPRPDVARTGVILEEDMTATGSRLLLKPVHLAPVPDGRGLSARSSRDTSSGDLAASGRANGVVVLDPRQGRFPSGSIVEAHPWARPW